MMHRTRTDFWSRRGIQPLEAATVFRCPCWHTTSRTGQAVCAVCKQAANIKLEFSAPRLGAS